MPRATPTAWASTSPAVTPAATPTSRTRRPATGRNWLARVAARWPGTSTERSCEDDCLDFDTSDCHTCGNSEIEGPELCDLDQLDGQDCKSLHYDGGELLCNQNCIFDISGCYDCGGMDPCEDVYCSGHGSCWVSACAPFCECDPGYRQGPNLTCIEDTPCYHDRECPPDQICSSGACTAGSACNYDYNCNAATEYCHPDGKVCKQRSALCESCAEDYECPDPAMGDMCISYPDGDYCGQRCGVTACPAGYDCDFNSGSGTGSNPGQCRSNTGSCEGTFICHGPGDCASNQVCNTQTGQCIPMCADDVQCPGGQKCHLTGHCGDPCAQDSDCTQYGSDLICCIAPSTPSQFCGVTQTGLCRPDGCALHSECLQTQGDSLGYCDDRTHTCMPGCRAADPAGVNDCVSGMKCECTGGTVSCDGFDCCPDPGAAGACLCDPQHQDCSQITVCDNGECLPIPCQERGDVNIACSRNQVCCGWPLADGYPCPAGTNEGECYMAPEEIWCSTCVSEGDPCEVVSYGYGEPGICMIDGGDGNTYCHLACRDNQDCPATWQCDFSYIQGCDPQQGYNCSTGASCEVAYRGYDDQGQVLEVSACICQTDEDCPEEINGFSAVCAPQQLCDMTVEPPDCRQASVCSFAKACQCSTCCSQLWSGG